MVSFIQNDQMSGFSSLHHTKMVRMKCPGVGVIMYERDANATISQNDALSSGCEITNMTYTRVQCYPLYSALLAIGVSTVDFFSLDIEGAELSVLKTLPFHKINIKVLLVEVVHITGAAKAELVEFMASKDYKKINRVGPYKVGDYTKEDYLFAKKSHLTLDDTNNYRIND